MELNLIIGIMGMFCILIAFVFGEFLKKFNRETISFNILNIVGSGLLLYYAFSLKGWPFVILNTAWLSAAAIKLVLILRK